jgi:trehalose synthase
VTVARRPAERLKSVVGPARYARVVLTADRFRSALAGRTIWNVNSTAVGGGVAEMLQGLVGYVADLGISIRWTVIDGDPEFFAITKHLHNLLHGADEPGPGGGGPGPREAAHYERVLAGNAAELGGRVSAGDIVLLHDPQTAGLAGALAAGGAHVIWRCHIGADRHTDATGAGWRFLLPYLEPVQAFVFSRRQYVPSAIPPALARIIPPSIDPFSPKNQNLDAGTVRAILGTAGVLDAPAGPGRFTRRDGDPGEVRRSAEVIAEALPGPADPVVVQVSRWDRLKDMAGVLHGFAEHVAPAGPGYLMLVGPAVGGVSDDPEGAQVHADCVARWRALPADLRARIVLASLPLDDVDENAAIVNAVQRNAAVVVQKSLAEGFGLTVAEGMWKGRPVVGSAVGGIVDQLVPETGVTLPDPADLAAFGAAVRGLLDDPTRAARIGAAAHAHVRDNFVGDLHLLRYAQLFGTLIGA